MRHDDNRLWCREYTQVTKSKFHVGVVTFLGKLFPIRSDERNSKIERRMLETIEGFFEESRMEKSLSEEMKKNRLQKRVSKNLLAQVRVSGGSFFAYIHDLAKNGIGMACNRDMEMGTEIECKLNVPGHKSMDLAGTVVWKKNLPSISRNRYKMGIRLTKKPETYDQYVEELLNHEYERRKDKRFSEVLEVESADVLDLLDAATADVSASGLYIRTGVPLQEGQEFEMKLSSPHLEQPLFCLGEVVATFSTEIDDLDHPYGAGVKIISFVGEDGKRFREYIRGLEELYHFHWPEELDPAQ